MNVLFDTSVLVPAFVDQLSNHPGAFETFSTYTSVEHRGYCSTHALAETYSVLTALPLQKKIHSVEARMLIEENIISRLHIVELDGNAYIRAINSAAHLGLGSGIVYDSLHVEAAKVASCSRIFTYNIVHFRSLCSEEILVTSP